MLGPSLSPPPCILGYGFLEAVAFKSKPQRKKDTPMYVGHAHLRAQATLLNWKSKLNSLLLGHRASPVCKVRTNLPHLPGCTLNKETEAVEWGTIGFAGGRGSAPLKGAGWVGDFEVLAWDFKHRLALALVTFYPVSLGP